MRDLLFIRVGSSRLDSVCVGSSRSDGVRVGSSRSDVFAGSFFRNVHTRLIGQAL